MIYTLCTSVHPLSGLPPAPTPAAGTAASTQTWNTVDSHLIIQLCSGCTPAIVQRFDCKPLCYVWTPSYVAELTVTIANGATSLVGFLMLLSELT